MENTQTSRSTFNCNKCKDVEFIITQNEEGYTSATPCECVKFNYFHRLLEKSGISEAFKQKTVNEYKPKNEQQKRAKKIAAEYINCFSEIRKQNQSSIAYLGQVGAGKTHLTIAIANAFLKQDIGVLYMQYRDVMTQLKQLKCDEENYQREIIKYKIAPVLLLDDLFKGATRNGKINESEVDILFEIVNHRYLSKLPILVSSQYTINEIVEFDEAVGSRIAEMCKGRTVEFCGTELNHRMV